MDEYVFYGERVALVLEQGLHAGRVALVLEQGLHAGRVA